MGTTKDAERKLLVELTDLLRKNADKVLEGDTKVCLTTNSLEILVSNFRRYSCGEGDEEEEPAKRGRSKQQLELKRWQDSIKTLLDFVLKIKALKIINSAQTLKAPILIARFSSLVVLEVKKVPIHMVEGVSKLRGQLREITIARSLQDLQGLLEICGGDRTAGLVWSCLTTAVLSFNGLEKLDNSLRLVPFLSVLDLSHNNLKNTENHLQSLNEVSKMNLGYNLLSQMPTLSADNKMKLRTLVLRNNNLDNLDGLEELTMLEELDVAENCLLDHKVLQVVRPLTRLRTLYLVGNPFCYKSDHRHLTLKQLSPQTALTMFILDGQKMSPYETSIVQTNHYHMRKSIIPTDDHTDGMETIVVRHKGKGGSAKSLSPGSYDKNKKRGHKRVHSKERVPAIGNIQETMTQEHTQEPSPATSVRDEVDIKSELEKEKQRYEILREHYKDDWLKALATEQGAYTDRPTTPGQPGAHTDTAAVKDKGQADVIDTNNKQDKSKGKSDKVSELPKPDISVTAHDEPDTAAIVVKSPTSNEPVHIVDTTDIYALRRGSRGQAAPMAEPEKLVLRSEVDIETSTDSEDQYGDECEPLIVMLPDSELRQILVTVNDRYILEKDSNGRKLAALDLKCLQNVQRKEEEVQGPDIVGSQVFTVIVLHFDYVKKDMRQRIYAMEDNSDAAILESLTCPHLKMKQDQANVRDHMECLKCKHQFSQLTSTELVSCPSCRSKMVIKINDTAALVATATPATGEPHPESQLEPGSLPKSKRSPALVRKSPGHRGANDRGKVIETETLQKEKFAGSLSEYVDRLIPGEETDDQVDKRKGLYKTTDDTTGTSNPDVSTALRVNNSWSDVSRMTSSQSGTRHSISSVESDITVLATNSRGSVSAITESSHEVQGRENRTGTTGDVEAHRRVPGSQEQGDTEPRAAGVGDTTEQLVKPDPTPVTPVGSPLSNSVCSSMVSSVYENTLSGGGEGAVPVGGAEDSLGNIMDSSFTSSSSDSVSVRHSAGSSEARNRRSKHRHATLYMKDSEPQSSPKDFSQDFNKSEEIIGAENSSMYDTALSQQTNESSLNSTNASINRTFPSIYDKTTDSDSEKPNDSDSFLAVPRRSRDPTSSQETSSSSPQKRPGNRSRSRSANRSAIYGETLLEESVESPNTPGLLDFPSDLSPIKKVPGQKKADHSSTNGNSQASTNGEVSKKDEETSVSVTSGNDSVASEKVLPWEQEDSRVKSAKHESLIHDEFVNINHRIQLFLELHVLKAEEQIQCAIQCPIVQYMMAKEVKSLLVITSSRILILRIEGELDSEMSVDCLKCYEDQPITELQYVDIGLGYQTLRLEFSTECSSFTLLICDEARCKQFLTLLSDIVQTTAIHEHSQLEGISKSNPTTLANLEQVIMATDDEEPDEEGEEERQKFVRYLLIRYVDPDTEDDEGLILGLVVTTTDLILVQENHQWPLPRLQAPLSEDLRGQQFTVRQREKINNIETFAFNEDNHSALRLTFFEMSGGDNTEPAWYITMETTKGVKSLVDAIREPWEEEFGVSLDVTSTSFTDENVSTDKPL